MKEIPGSATTDSLGVGIAAATPLAAREGESNQMPPIVASFGLIAEALAKGADINLSELEMLQQPAQAEDKVNGSNA